jgi:DGQHR domain-containing protein
MSVTTPTDEIDLSAGVLVRGIEIEENTYFATTNFQVLRVITRNPVLLQANNKKGRELDPDIEREQDIHELIQRALAGGKKKNAEKYADYIEAKVSGASIGVLPPMHLWSPEQLELTSGRGGSYIVIPHGEKLLAIDGETQLTAHWKLDARQTMTHEQRKAHREHPLGVIIHHGIDTKHARQYFHDLNVLAVRPNTSLSLGMDTHDPIMRIVESLETDIPALTGRVEKQARQLTKTSSKIVTLQNLRQMVINTAKGISGIQYGARPVPLEDIDVQTLTKVATSWASAFFDAFAMEVTDRESYLASSGAVLAAVGAMGQEVYRAGAVDRPALAENLITSLKDVDWSKGDHWAGIAGNVTSRGAFSVKGTKEVAYAVHAALADDTSAGYRRIRHLSPREGNDANRWQ